MEFELRRWNMGDKESLVKHANNKNIAKFLTNQFPYPYSEQDAVDFINLCMRNDSAIMFTIDVDGEAIGSIGVFPQSDIHCKNAELGYWLSEDYWGKGIMTEAIKRMVGCAFDTYDINRIFARPFGINGASQRVLEKAGFKLEARFKDALYKYGEYMDELIYAIRKE